MKNSFRLLGILALSVTLLGCGGKDSKTAKLEPAADEHAADGNRAKVVSPSNVSSQSPAFHAEPPVPNDATPEQVALEFMNSMQKEDDRRTAALLTDVAREETQRIGLEVQPIAEPSATYKITDVEYVSEAKDGAHVTSVWTENGDDGQPYSYEIVWILRRQPHNGWRISGMATRVFPGEPFLFLNFENPKDMLAKYEQAHQEHSESQETGEIQARNPASGSGNAAIQR